MIELLDRNKNEMQINELSPLTWAYVGDSVFELYVRTYLVENTKLKPHELHIEAIKYVKADNQAFIVKKLIDEELNDEEKEIVRRGRNTENHHLPKNAKPEDYMYSTAFEALIGYLYLTKKDERVKELIEKSINIRNQME